MSTYSTASENSASDASPTALPVPIPSTNEAYVLIPATWGGPAWTDLDPTAPADNWEEDIRKPSRTWSIFVPVSRLGS
ncbi:hypothetical protein M378DRAFT_17360 [Amanita muscaria Koide BX008]|uniref:Uncharacterized protein n=1 Tax=Amanita muscaria (strain Koide BX008) TaxID=946122 RepID=A0A0C2SQ43_AMAMK|nr:hypothetical protein M378DRAFT_17360 [Amanita muscaria Koide BX008]